MNESERLQLAEHLAKMKYKRARAEIRKLDPEAVLRYWRNAIKNEWHTLYLLPNMDLKITLVEIPQREAIAHQPKHIGLLERVEPLYVEARVEPLPPELA